MADTREALEMMREVARIRIDMLKRGVTFHDENKRKYYLGEYVDKLGKIERIIRRLNIRLVQRDVENQDKDSS